MSDKRWYGVWIYRWPRGIESLAGYCDVFSAVFSSPNLSLASISSAMSGSASFQSSVKRSYHQSC